MNRAPIDSPFVPALLDGPVGRVASLGRGRNRIVVGGYRIRDEAVDSLSDSLWRSDDRCRRSPQTPIRVRRTHAARRTATTDERTSSAFLGRLCHRPNRSGDRGWYRPRSSHTNLARFLCTTVASNSTRSRFHAGLRQSHESDALRRDDLAFWSAREFGVQDEHLHERDRNDYVHAYGREEERRNFPRAFGLRCDAAENHQARAIPCRSS